MNGSNRKMNSAVMFGRLLNAPYGALALARIFSPRRIASLLLSDQRCVSGSKNSPQYWESVWKRNDSVLV